MTTSGTSQDGHSLPGCRLRRVTEYIQQNLDKELTLAELAAVVYMSPYHFARLFKGSTGVPPHRFVVRQRIARARGVLATPELSIAQISRLVGFRTPSHFITVFRRVLGITPGAYRSLRADRPGGKEGEMAQRTYQEPGVAEQRPRFPRKAIDPDAALVAQLRRADAGAAEALVAAYGSRVYRMARRITGNAADAEEVVQDTLWTVSRKIDTFRGTSAFGSWVYRITANAAYQKLRKTRSQRHEVSWEDLVPSLDDFGQHAEAAMDWSRRLKDPAVEGELKRVLDRRAAGGLPHGLSPARCGRVLEPRDRSDPADQLARDQVARAPGATVPAEAVGRLRGCTSMRHDCRRQQLQQGDDGQPPPELPLTISRKAAAHASYTGDVPS